MTRRIFAGHLVRELRARLGLAQAEMAVRLKISVSYLSQIENGDRPITPAVLGALGEAFPGDWATIDPQEESSLLIEGADAASDPSVPEATLGQDAVRRGVKQQPLLVRRLVALHNAFRRSQDQLRVLDDRFEAGAVRLPWDEVRDWFHAERNYVDAIDREAERIAEEGPSLEQRLAEHGVTVASGPMLRAYDPATRTLHLDSSQPPETRLFSIAHQLARLEFAGLIEEIAARALGSDAARELLSAGLANYAAGALVMPYARFRAAAREVRHDIDRLRQRFGTSFEQACHRLSTLQRPGALGIPFFFCRVDMAGTSPSATRPRACNSPASAAPARSGWCTKRWRSPTASSSSSPRPPTASATSRWPRGWSSPREATLARRAAMPSRSAARKATPPISSMPMD
jgi:transcriptional regulator with XRE-family HTH domain